MAYIGRQLVRGTNRVLDDISGSFNGSTTTFNLTVDSSASPPGSQNQLWVSIGGVFQEPGTDFTVADAQITFTTAPASTLGFWGMIQGDVTDGVAPSDASVSPAKIASTGDFAFPADVRFKDADGSHYVGLQAPTTVSSNLVWTLPAADGSANQYLKTDGSGALSWGSDSATDATKMPLAGGTFTGDVTFDGQTAGRDIVWDRSADNLTFADNAKAVFGTGGDLSVYADGSNSKIVHSGDGGLVIEAAGTDEDITIQATDDVFIKVQGSENAIRCLGDAAVELYHNNVKKVETASNGIAVAGQVDCTGGGVLVDDSYSFSAGTGGDLTVYHNGSNSYIANSTGNLMITGNNSDKIHIRAHASKQEIVCTPSAGVQLFYDDVKKFETTSAGATVSGNQIITGASGNTTSLQINNATDTDGVKLLYSSSSGVATMQVLESGSGFSIYCGGSNAGNRRFQAYSDTTPTVLSYGDENMGVFTPNSSVALYHDNVKKFETHSSGITVIGSEGANGTIQFHADEGDDNADIWLAQATTTGEFRIQNYASGSWEKSIECGGNGDVELYYDNSKKFETTAAGVVVNGGIYLDGSGGAAAANKLEDYEEGTWTPAATSGTFTSASGTYTKIGRMVTCVYVVTVHTSTSGNYMQFNGLPFTNGNATAGSNSSGLAYTNGSHSNGVYGYVSGGGTAVLFSNHAGTFYTYANFSTDFIRGAVTYFV